MRSDTDDRLPANNRRPTWPGLILGTAIAFAPFVVVAGWASETAVQAASPAIGQGAVLAVEDQRFRAQIDRDAGALERLVADDAAFAHATGYRQSKADFIAAVVSGRLAYRAIVPQERSVILLGDVAVVNGVLSMDVGEKSTVNSYLAVYAMRQGRWQLLRWQSGAGPRTATAGQ